MKIQDISAVVTGARSGLGAATAAALAAQGARVFGLDLPDGDAGDVRGLTYLDADVTKAEEVAAGIAVAEAAGPLRVVVNCAGIAPSARILGRSGPHDLDLFARVIQVNLVGTFNVVALAAEAIARTEPLRDGQRGVIVNTASVAAFEGQIGQAAYAASKGGVHALTLPAARDLASYGIRVNTIAPGILDTPMLASVGDEYRAGLAEGVPFPKRLGRPEEYADLVQMLVASDYLNGETIRLDGGLRMAAR